MEGYAVYYKCGIADEYVGYQTTGKSYCEIFKEYLPYIISSMKNGFYKNASWLFLFWHARVLKEEMGRRIKEVGSKIDTASKEYQELRKGYSELEYPPIKKPIGCE